jgi:carboxypeptidase family protein
MKKMPLLFLLLCVLLSGCTFNVDVLTPAPSVTESSQLTPYATQIVPSPVATISATAELLSPTPVPATTYPVFSNARTSSSPDDFNQISSFPAGTKIVYAIWDYQNMHAGLKIRREWYWNDQLWLTREEEWDFQKYGAAGTIRDISIYDNETGLNSGTYQLRLYIDSVQQPIGPGINTPIKPWITFDIGLDEARQGYASPDFQWSVLVFNGKRIVLQDKSGNSTTITSAREVPYLTWFSDSKHFLFVDRDRSAQKAGTQIGIRDDLWIVDVPNGTQRLLYKNDTAFYGYAGPMPSPDGKYIASPEGSMFADACSVDSRMIFFELASDFSAVKPIQQSDFSGLPTFNLGWVYPKEDGEWETNNQYLVTYNGTCDADQSQLGPYLFNLSNLTASPSSSVIFQRNPGDLGWGFVHGKITDATTGAPIAGATVTCDHHSYTSPVLCSGTATTNADGIFIFGKVFFHDTDTIHLTVQAQGYQAQEVTQSSFTTADMESNIALQLNTTN